MTGESNLLVSVGSWLLTYTAHSTVLLATAWVATQRLRPDRDLLRETIWKLALVGGFFTATLQVSADVDPILGRIELRWRSEPSASGADVLDSSLAIKDSETQAIPMASLANTPPFNPVEAASSNLGDRKSLGSRERPEDSTSRPLGSQKAADTTHLPGLSLLGAGLLPAATVAASVLGLFVGLIALVIIRLHRRTSRLLRSRSVVCDPRALSLLAELRELAGFRRTIRLTSSPDLNSPIAFGILRPEICLPRRALRSLPPLALRGILGHEVAHLKAGDPLWLQITHGIRVALFFQPLNRIASSRLRELAEFRCDAWAAREAGEPLAYADCLTRVASWLVHSPPPRSSPGFAAMAEKPSSLGRRVARILDEKRGPDIKPTPRGSVAFGVGLLILTTLLVPGIRATETSARPSIETTQLNSLEPPKNDRYASSPPTEDEAPSGKDRGVSGEWRRLERDFASLESEIDQLQVSLARTEARPQIDQNIQSISQAIERLEAQRKHVNQLMSRLGAAIEGPDRKTSTLPPNPTSPR